MLPIIVILVIIVDQITKYMALSLKDGKIIQLIGDHLALEYLENRGAAFGILQNQKGLLMAATVAIIVYLIYFYFQYRNTINLTMKISIGMILGGAVGNMIDRTFRGFVVDFISYTFPNGYRFPIFNIADMAVVIGCCVLIIASFWHKEEESIG